MGAAIIGTCMSLIGNTKGNGRVHSSPKLGHCREVLVDRFDWLYVRTQGQDSEAMYPTGTEFVLSEKGKEAALKVRTHIVNGGHLFDYEDVLEKYAYYLDEAIRKRFVFPPFMLGTAARNLMGYIKVGTPLVILNDLAKEGYLEPAHRSRREPSSGPRPEVQRILDSIVNRSDSSANEDTSTGQKQPPSAPPSQEDLQSPPEPLPEASIGVEEDFALPASSTGLESDSPHTVRPSTDQAPTEDHPIDVGTGLDETVSVESEQNISTNQARSQLRTRPPHFLPLQKTSNRHRILARYRSTCNLSRRMD